MLNDDRRNRLYDDAIREACTIAVKRRVAELSAVETNEEFAEDEGGGRFEAASANGTSKEGEENTRKIIRILDVGSGTGLLAIMGARHALDAARRVEAENENVDVEVRVTSVEMASAMARLARITIDENDLTTNVRVVECHSTDTNFVVDDDDGLADVCTSELLESGLLGEGVLPSMRDAWERHLRPDAIVVPRRARVFAVPVEGATMSRRMIDDEGGVVVVVNAVTAFIGPEPRTFFAASRGIRPTTTAAVNVSADDISSSPDVTGDDRPGRQRRGATDDGGVLLGAISRRDDSMAERGGGATFVGGGITVPLHADAMLDGGYRDPSANLTGHELGVGGDFKGMRPLAEPAMVLDFDFASGANAIPLPAGRSTTTWVTPTVDGSCHGVLFWWELDLWDRDDDSCTYSTAPAAYAGEKSNDGGKVLWQDHWQQCLFVFGDGHSENSSGRLRRRMTRGTPVKLIASHDDSSIAFSIDTGAYCAGETEDRGDARPMQRRKSDEFNHIKRPLLNRHISPQRALQLNDSSRISTLTAAIRYCIDAKGRDESLLDLSDFGLCAMIASVCGARKVTSLESSNGTLPTLAATVAQIGNELPRKGCDFQVIRGLAEHISRENVFNRAAEIVVAEPYYEMMEGWHMQEALNYFYTVRSLRKRGVISPTALSVPSYANVLACIVEFDEFSTAYGKVGDESGQVSGIRHSVVNYYGDRYHTYDLSLPLWQYRYKRISKTCRVAKISYEGEAPTIDIEVDCAAELISSGIAHAVVIWIDYACRVFDDSTKDPYVMMSTASSSHLQLVRKLPESFAFTEEHVAAGCKVYCNASFGVEPGGIEDHSFAFEVHLK